MLLRAQIFEIRSPSQSATSNVLSVLCVFGSVQPDIQHVAMLRRLAGVALSSGVDELEALALEERLGTGGADG